MLKGKQLVRLVGPYSAQSNRTVFGLFGEGLQEKRGKTFYTFRLSTGQKSHDTLEIGELFMEIEDNISEKVESVPEEAFERSL